MLWLCLRTWWVSDRHSLDIEVGYALRCCCSPYWAPDWKCIEKFVKMYNQSLKHKVHRWVLSLRLNKYKLSASRTAAGTGRLFHTTGLAKGQILFLSMEQYSRWWTMGSVRITQHEWSATGVTASSSWHLRGCMNCKQEINLRCNFCCKFFNNYQLTKYYAHWHVTKRLNAGGWGLLYER